MGIIASVRVSLTIVADSRVFVLYRLSHALAVAVTEEVSLTAVPAKRENPSLERCSQVPRVGKIRAAMTLKKKMTEMA